MTNVVKLNRIPAIDGLRTIAVLGVLWAHIWSFFNNIPCRVGFDVNRGISFGRNGVDLFFVISGFCMYLMYGSKINRFTIYNFANFLKRRWLRIAPAFYILILIESVRLLIISGIFPFKNCIYHIFFINIFSTNNLFSPHYWSLATEFHFYLVFPLLFLFLKSQKDFIVRILILSAITLIFRGFYFYYHQESITIRETIVADEIWFRFSEFGFGIIAAVMFISGTKLPRWMLSPKGILIGLMVSCVGRIFMLTEFINHFGRLAFIFRTFSEPVMTLGFGILLLSLISQISVFSKILSSRPFIFLGKISYSMYLWHYLLAQYIAIFIINKWGISLPSMYLCILVTLVLLIPVSWISFKAFEASYFKKVPEAKKMGYVEVV